MFKVVPILSECSLVVQRYVPHQAGVVGLFVGGWERDLFGWEGVFIYWIGFNLIAFAPLTLGSGWDHLLSYAFSSQLLTCAV